MLSIDYTNLDYESLRETMLDLAQESLPEWTDFSENDLGVLLVELFAYACDITLYYQTRIANNLFPETADEPDALIQLLRLIGYELSPPAPATANLRIGFDAAALPAEAAAEGVIVISRGTQFSASLPSGEQVVFETEQDVRIEEAALTTDPEKGLCYFAPLPVVQGETVIDDPGQASDGGPNQRYTLLQKPVIAGSVEVAVNEPGGYTRWQAVETLAYSNPVDRHFVVQRDIEGAVTLRFGDGTNGMIPPRGTAVDPVIIQPRYRVGGGTQGNVAAGTQFTVNPPTALLYPTAVTPLNSPLEPQAGREIAILEAVNLQAAAGGRDRENIDRARQLAPRLFRTQERAVTAQDYVDLALQVPGVGKAKAKAVKWNQVELYIAPAGRVTSPSELLKRDLIAFFESRRMVTTGVTIVGPKAVDIYLRATVRGQPYFRQVDVKVAVEQAVAGYLAFDAVEFGQWIYLSKVYEIIQSLEQVASLTITQFSRHSTTAGVEADGILELEPNELPRPGYRSSILVTIKGEGGMGP